MTNREIVIKGLECHKDPCGPCTDCPYNDSKRDCAYSLCEDALKLLKEQPEIVRCKDCKHYMTIHCTCDGCCISDDWYCADAERLEVE